MQRPHVLSQVHAVATAEDLLEGVAQLQAPEGIDERVDDRVTHDEDQVGIEVGSVADTVGVGGAGYYEDKMEEEGGPAEDEDPQQDGDGDCPLHAGVLLRGRSISGWQRGDALDVQPGEEEHVHVEGAHEQQHGKEHGDQAHDDHLALGVDDEHHTADAAAQPDGHDQGQCLPHGHDAVVAECIEDGDVPVNRNGQKVADGGHQGDADHGVKDIVHVLDELVLQGQVVAVDHGDHDGLQGIGHAHQHVGHSQAAEEEVHGGVQVAIPDHRQDDQDVFQQADDAQGQEDLGLDEDLLTEAAAALVAEGRGSDVL